MPAKKTTTQKTAAPAGDITPAPVAAATPKADKKAVQKAAAKIAPSGQIEQVEAERDTAFDSEIAAALGVPAGQQPDVDEAENDAETGDDADAGEEITGGDDVGNDDATGEDQADPADQADQTDADAGEDAGDDDAAGGEDAGDDDGEAAEPAPADDRVAALEAQVADLTAKLSAAQQPAAPAQAAAPRQFSNAEEEVATAETPEELLRLRDKFQRWEDFAAENPEGFDADPATPGGEPRHYSAEEVRRIGKNARAALRSIPQQAQLLQQRNNFNALADKAYPAFADAKSELSKHYATLRQHPAFRHLPYLKLIIGDADVGRRAREAKEKAAAGDGRPGTKVAPTARRPVPVLPTGSARKPAPATTAQAKKASAQKRLNASNGSAGDLAAFLEDTL